MGLPDGIVRRKKPDGEYQKYLYFNKCHRGRRIRGSSGTSDPQEAQSRLNKIITDLDNARIYGVRPDRPFRAGAEKLISEFQGADKTLRIYAQQADVVNPWIGSMAMRLIYKDTLMPMIHAMRSEGKTVRTINMAIEFVRLVLRRAAYYWREDGLSWIENCPILPFEKGRRKVPYTLSVQEEYKFLDALPGLNRKAALFDLHTGLRDTSLVELRWEWEKFEECLGETMFWIPGEVMKNKKPMPVILNNIARAVVEYRRGAHPDYVFGEIYNMTEKVWNKAWREAGLPVDEWTLKGVHNLRHTFGKRLRNCGVEERDVADLLHHVPKNLTRHYSAPELMKLKSCLELLAQNYHTPFTPALPHEPKLLNGMVGRARFELATNWLKASSMH